MNEVTITRREPLKIAKTTVPTEPATDKELREIYRNIAEKYIDKLQRSVCKKYESPFSYETFQGEIKLQQNLADQVFYIQNCRAAIELALREGAAVVDGQCVMTTFTKQADGKILVVESEQ